MAGDGDPAQALRPFWAESGIPSDRWLYYAFQARRYGSIAGFLAGQGPWSDRRVLDLGGGVGSLGVVLHQELGGSYDLAEFEAPTGAHAEALGRRGVRRCFRVDLRSPSALEGLPSDYNAVLLVEVLEHLLVNPLLLFRQVWEHLRPGGLFFLTTPNQARLRNRVRLVMGRSIKEDGRYPWQDTGVYGHVIEFTLDELHRLATAESFAEVGARVVQQVPSVSPTSLQRAGVRLLNSAVGRRLRLGDDLLVAYRKVPRPEDGRCPVLLDGAGRICRTDRLPARGRPA